MSQYPASNPPSEFNDITSLSDFRGYIKRQLGSPVLCVEIDDSQLNDVIYDSIQISVRYLYGEAAYKDYVAISLSAGTSAYNLSAVDGDCIEDVIDMEMTSMTGSLNSLFSLKNYAAADIFSQNLHDGSNWGQGMNLANFQSTLIYADEVNMALGRTYRTDYQSPSQILRIIPTPDENGVGLLQVYRKEKTLNLYNHILIKNLAVAKSMKLWGLHLKKYQMTMPGGGTINGESIYQDGVREEEKAMEALKFESSPPDFFIG